MTLMNNMHAFTHIFIYLTYQPQQVKYLHQIFISKCRINAHSRRPVWLLLHVLQEIPDLSVKNDKSCCCSCCCCHWKHSLSPFISICLVAVCALTDRHLMMEISVKEHLYYIHYQDNNYTVTIFTHQSAEYKECKKSKIIIKTWGLWFVTNDSTATFHQVHQIHHFEEVKRSKRGWQQTAASCSIEHYYL